MPKSGEHTRREILKAANRVVINHGVESLTLEATAREAGISKGGLLYHFPNKEALIIGMIRHYLERFESDLRTSAGSLSPEQPGRWTQAYLETTFADNERTPRLNAGLLAAISTNPALLSPVQESFAEWVSLLEKDGVDPVLATIVRLAADGLWLVELFGLAPPDPEMKARVLQALAGLSKTATPGAESK
jgi:AcrR family transcriptional regulator